MSVLLRNSKSTSFIFIFLITDKSLKKGEKKKKKGFKINLRNYQHSGKKKGRLSQIQLILQTRSLPIAVAPFSRLFRDALCRDMSCSILWPQRLTAEIPETSPWLSCIAFRYRDFRYPPGHQHQYEHNIYYWHVIAAKLAFIIVMEVSVWGFKQQLLWASSSLHAENPSKPFCQDTGGFGVQHVLAWARAWEM